LLIAARYTTRHYFGAIVDDGGASVGVSWGQGLVVAHPKDARVRIQVV
jgi:hypothetical protein